MSNYDGKIELPQMYNNQGEEQYLSSDKSDTYLWLAEENTKQAKKIKRLQEQLKEANEVIEYYKDIEVVPNYVKLSYDSDDWYCEPLAQDYLVKWGVK